ncbi:tensin-4-like isoform X2, partial [Biomphalaria pfeifferi]
YIGTFSVSGSDKEARERQMEAQLEQIRTARDSRAVNLVISNNGVKVILKENNNVFMDHSLKRIWYATCDPEYCQFSFLAREPKTSAEVQYCHAFITDTAEQAEELISIIGEAFKSTYQQGKRQPTFHELIEQQVQEQQAKFREIEKEAKNALQKKLKEIATPTPFSERAQSRMERRRQSDEVEIVTAGDKKNWAKVQVEASGVAHVSFTDRNYNSSAAANRRSEIPTRQTTPHSSPFKRNSVPPQGMSSLVPSSPPPPHPLSAMAIKESLENRNSNSKFKGSPVTALKNEIDRRLPMSNGTEVSPTLDHRDFLAEQKKQQLNAMANRPLPQPPAHSASPQRSQRPAQQQSPHRLQQRSLDDYHLPRSSVSHIPLSASASKGVTSSASGNVKLRDSPRRKQPRPHSEIATSSSGAAGSGAPGGSNFYEQQRQSLLNNFAASFNLPSHIEGSCDGMYIYGPSDSNDPRRKENGAQQDQSRGRDLNRRAESAGKGNADPRPRKEEANVRPPHSSQGQNRLPGGAVSRAKSPRSGSHAEPVVPRYQNDSPFQNDHPEKGSKQTPGFESLMCLDRSHIHDETLRNMAWYQAGLPREIALEILQQEDVGSFIVRDSSTHPGCYALSVRVPKYENATGISHYLILRTHRGVKLKGLDKEWSTLTALVTHHTVMREMLPCTLKLPKVKGQVTQGVRPADCGNSNERASLEGDNYHQLGDVAGLMGQLKM